jgi:PST family polysaccharide transporter
MLTLQAVGVGAPLAALAIAADPLVPFLFGEEWRPVLGVLPYVCFSYLVLGLFNTHIALLYVLGRTRATSLISFARFVVTGATAFLLVPVLDLEGYGLALVAASGAVWVLADRTLRSELDFVYGGAARWVVVLAPTMFVPLVAFPWSVALVAPVAILLLVDAAARAQLRWYLHFVRHQLGRAASDGVTISDDTHPKSEIG